MGIVKGVLIILLAGWAIVAFGSVAVFAGLWEVLNRVFRGREK